ncbi:MAG: DUF455 family protein [Akkermansiaceae bacterium]|nr:DUF455 family protein [Akkermansiaceae bacterium]
MRMREAAERVLFGVSLEEKLQLSPAEVDDSAPGKALATPEGPGRPPELRVVADGVRADFPSENRLDQDRERGRMFHFLANHELLAAELMALVLLKFPDAPREYRAGVYEAMREEQMHTLMYLRRMRECGIEFGELPVNDYFWRLVSPMASPMEFVTRLNLTFEQANLDFSKHYAKLFRQVGDKASAKVLEKIYQDEIGHVGHGVKWFRQWKEQGSSDWEAFQTYMEFPFAAAKAKGMAPFNAEGRRLAGLDEDFIARLEVCEQSRGRTPVLHAFNPFAEEELAASLRGESFTPRKSAVAMEHDGEMVMMAWCRRDDILQVRELPSLEHLARLQRAGFQLPEFLTAGQLDGRKLGGMRPWAWSPVVSAQWETHADQVSSKVPWQWREPLPAEWLSKKIGVRLLESLEVKDRPQIIDNRCELAQIAQRMLANGPVLLKGLHACAGRSQYKVEPDAWDAAEQWAAKQIERDGALLVEAWRERVADFSMLYEMTADGAQWVGATVMENDARGGYLGSRVAAKWTSLLDPELSRWLHREAGIKKWIEERWPRGLESVLPGYVGPVGIDCLVHRDGDGRFGWLPVVELNVRMTMGRVALELAAKSRPGKNGCLRILRKKGMKEEEVAQLQSGSLQGGSVLLNDPQQAREFLFSWEVGS